jgi:hypothetical protein
MWNPSISITGNSVDHSVSTLSELKRSRAYAHVHTLMHFIFVCDRRTLILQFPTIVCTGYCPYACRAAAGSAHAAPRGQGRLEVPALPHAGHPHLMRSVTHTSTDRQSHGQTVTRTDSQTDRHSHGQTVTRTPSL